MKILMYVFLSVVLFASDALAQKQNDHVQVTRTRNDQTTSGTIRGKVYDSEGRTEMLFIVTINGVRLPVTNEKGEFRYIVDPGDYVISCISMGSAQVTSEKLTIKPGDVVAFRFRLPPGATFG